MTDLYPHSIQEWSALGGAVVAFLGLAASGLWRAWTYHGEQKQNEWERLHELLKILYNKDHEYGEWTQLAAVYELRSVRTNSKTLAVIVSNVAEHWTTNQKVSPQLMGELRKLQLSLPKVRGDTRG